MLFYVFFYFSPKFLFNYFIVIIYINTIITDAYFFKKSISLESFFTFYCFEYWS